MGLQKRGSWIGEGKGRWILAEETAFTLPRQGEMRLFLRTAELRILWTGFFRHALRQAPCGRALVAFSFSSSVGSIPKSILPYFFEYSIILLITNKISVCLKHVAFSQAIHIFFT